MRPAAAPAIGMVVAILFASCPEAAPPAAAEKVAGQRAGRVRVVGHSLVDDDGPFLGLGASYFTSLWRCKNDRARLESDLAFLAKQGFNYYRMLSMVGHHPGWEGREIAPVAFANKDGKRVEAWADYWEQIRALIDLAYDKHGMRTQITIFADAQLMPDRRARIEHMRKLLADVVPGREHKIILIEVANEAWQNGFPGDQGVADLREFAKYLSDRTEILVAITSNHDWPPQGIGKSFEQVYRGASADLATWHFSRDRRTDEGWRPVHDCWEYGDLPGLPPVSSNEPIGPGSSVNVEKEPIRLVMAAAFAYTARLPMYVFHSGAGVMGKTRFEEMPGIDRFGHILRLLPGDLADWQRNDGKEASAPFTVFAGGQRDRYWPQVKGAPDGCVRNTGSRKGDRFVCVPIGIRAGGLTVEARQAVQFEAHNPLTGEVVQAATMRAGERRTLPAGPGALIIIGRALPRDAKEKDGPARHLTLGPKEGNPRNSEGDFVRLKDGRILFIYTHFTGGGADHAAAHLASRVSTDGGRTWSERDEAVPTARGRQNVMSVSLLRLKSGKVALFCLVKNSGNDCRAYVQVSEDEGSTWSAPTLCMPQVGYYVVNNDRVIQLEGGRLVIAAAWHRAAEGDRFSARAVCFLSDDEGKTWRAGRGMVEPPAKSASGLQEPGVVELKDGRLMMLSRTDLSSQYRCYSSDGGETWTAAEETEIRSPLSPASIERIPATGDLLLIWNDHSKIEASLKGKRTPLTAAVSKDEGRTWSEPRVIEDDPEGWYCYTAIEFVDDRVLLAYCAGRGRAQGLTTTAIASFSVDWLYGR